jgi:glutamate N-acetyltransferase/amino-acid N-acetyltransferase
VTAARGFRAGAVSVGVKDGPSRLDLAVVVADAPCVAHALFTQCQVVAAPVIVSRERIASGRAQGIVLNSGNANACTGAAGMAAAREMADRAAAQVGIEPGLMLVASTGVIGVPLPMDRLRHGLGQLEPTSDGGHDTARAIMTTDLVPKEYAVGLDLGGARISIGGMAKGSGMIHPKLATMLAVVTTDAALDAQVAQSALRAAADRSFNQISVDRDTSTNDMLLLLANGASAIPPIRAGTPEAAAFGAALETVCVELARMIARDGEGATRLVEVTVEGAQSEEEARRVAREVVSSNLVKAAIYGQDPNWGRILSAVGNAGATINPSTIDVYIGNCQVAAAGAAASFDPALVRSAMEPPEVQIRVALHMGAARGRAWGCDLTEGYVKINAEYTT